VPVQHEAHEEVGSSAPAELESVLVQSVQKDPSPLSRSSSSSSVACCCEEFGSESEVPCLLSHLAVDFGTVDCG
jgi:hypothetical protein